MAEPRAEIFKELMFFNDETSIIKDLIDDASLFWSQGYQIDVLLHCYEHMCESYPNNPG